MAIWEDLASRGARASRPRAVSRARDDKLSRQIGVVGRCHPTVRAFAAPRLCKKQEGKKAEGTWSVRPAFPPAISPKPADSPEECSRLSPACRPARGSVCSPQPFPRVRLTATSEWPFSCAFGSNAPNACDTSASIPARIVSFVVALMVSFRLHAVTGKNLAAGNPFLTALSSRFHVFAIPRSVCGRQPIFLTD